MILKLFHIILFCSVTTLSWAQVKLSIDSTDMLIGDQRKLTLSANIPAGAEWINQDITLSDTLKSVQSLRTSDPIITSTGNQMNIKKEWVIAAFDTGLIYLPRMPLVIRKGGDIDTVYSNNIPIMVRGVGADSTGLAPIKSIFEEPGHWTDYIWLMAIAFGIILLGILYYLWKNKKKEEPIEIIIERPSDEIALDKLVALEKSQLWQKGEIKAYHSQLTYIFREYMEKRYQIKALESTTDEIKNQLHQIGISEEKQLKSIELLQLSDMVKFAKAKPRIEIHAELMQYVKDFIISTKLQPIITLPFKDEEE